MTATLEVRDLRTHFFTRAGVIRAVDGVKSTETHLYLGLAKQTYAWGTRGPQGPTSSDAGL